MNRKFVHGPHHVADVDGELVMASMVAIAEALANSSTNTRFTFACSYLAEVIVQAEIRLGEPFDLDAWVERFSEHLDAARLLNTAAEGHG